MYNHVNRFFTMFYLHGRLARFQFTKFKDVFSYKLEFFLFNTQIPIICVKSVLRIALGGEVYLCTRMRHIV